MNLQEVKFFSGTEKSREFDRLNPDSACDFELYKILRAALDLDNIVSFREHAERKDVTVIELFGEPNTYMVPMGYDNFKSFLKGKINIKSDYQSRLSDAEYDELERRNS